MPTLLQRIGSASPLYSIPVCLYSLALLILLFRPQSFRPSFLSSSSSPDRANDPESVRWRTYRASGNGTRDELPGWVQREKEKGPYDGWEIWKNHNVDVLEKLERCLAKGQGSCPGPKGKVVILESKEFLEVLASQTGGEHLWARSMMETMTDLGYSWIYAWNLDHAITLYPMLASHVAAVVALPAHLRECADDATCVKSGSNPTGIPLERLFAFSFWSETANPLGPRWTLQPEPILSDRTYIGYSIERQCMAIPVPPYAERKRRVWVLAKHSGIFFDVALPKELGLILQQAAKELDVEFVGAWRVSDPSHGKVPGVKNLSDGGAFLDEQAFYDALKESLAIVGVGRPINSPTPYYGVCLGTPFINPRDGPWSQHPYLALESESSGVYNVTATDNNFISQLRKAIAPHERFVPSRMTQAAVAERVQAWLETDWLAVAAAS